MITIIKNIKVYKPQYFGVKDILIVGEKIGTIHEGISASFKNGVKVNIIDGSGKIAVPGFIDSHVHIIGGGGEGSFKTRTPEIMLTDLTTNGITTVVGCIGVDSVTKNPIALLAKARGLEEEGLTTFIYTGSYRIPVSTITGGVIEDLMAIDKIIGVGEIAISDHRSSQPTFEEFVKVAADARVGGMLSGKAGILDVHLGDGPKMLELITKTVEETEIPITQFLPTHINRNSALFEAGIEYARKGGFIDLTGTDDPEFLGSDIVRVGKGMKRLLAKGISDDNFALSSDAQGSMPIFNEKKEYQGLRLGTAACLWNEIKDCVLKENIPLEIAIKAITSNPARMLKLGNKGRLESGYDADLCLLNESDLELDTVIAKGKIMVQSNKPIFYGTFENRS